MEESPTKSRFKNVVRFFQLKSPTRHFNKANKPSNTEFSSLSKHQEFSQINPLSNATLIGGLESDSDSDSEEKQSPNPKDTFSFFSNLQKVLGSASPQKHETLTTLIENTHRYSTSSSASSEHSEKSFANTENHTDDSSKLVPQLDLSPSKNPADESQNFYFDDKLKPQDASKSGRSSVAWQNNDKLQSLKELYRQFVLQSEQQRQELLQLVTTQEGTIQKLRKEAASHAETELNAAAAADAAFGNFAKDTEQKLALLTLQTNSLQDADKAKEDELRACRKEIADLKSELSYSKLAVKQEQTLAESLKIQNVQLDKLVSALERENAFLKQELQEAKILATREQPTPTSSFASLPISNANNNIVETTPSFRTFGFSSNASLVSATDPKLVAQSPVSILTTPKVGTPAINRPNSTASTLTQLSKVLSSGTGQDYVEMVSLTEKRLAELSAEKDRLSSEYSRMPLSARSNMHRVRRIQVEERLEQVDKEIGTVRSQLRFLHAI